MATRMQQRRGTAAQWTAADPVLAAGEIGFETDNNRFKIGDGVNSWSDLDYFANSAELTALLDGAPEALNTLNELAAAINDDPDFFTNISQEIDDSVSLSVSLAHGYTDEHKLETTNVHGIADTSLLATTSQLTTHTALTQNVHGIADTSVLATTSHVETVLSSHNQDTTNVHGIADTSALATLSDISSAIGTHNAVTLDVHGIADTSVLATQSYVDSAEEDAVETAGIAADDKIAEHDSDTTNVHGIADTSALATSSDVTLAVSDHNAVTTNVHGIADTSVLETTTGSQSKADLAVDAAENYVDSLVGDVTVDGTAGNTVTDRIASAEAYTDSQIDSHVAVTTNVHGIADTAKIVLKDAASTTLDGDLVVSGDFTVTGTTTTVSAQDLVVTDPLIYIGEGNSANLVDLGLVSSFDDGTYQHAGIVRDASDSKWKIFKGVTDEPSTTINFAQGSLDDLAVNNVEVAGVVFSDGTQTKQGVASLTPIIQKTASYTLSSLTERDSLIEFSSSSGITVTIPAESSVNYPVGTSIDILQTSTGQVTIDGAAGVIVNATPGLKLRSQWSSATLFKRSADTWIVMGDLSA